MILTHPLVRVQRPRGGTLPRIFIKLYAWFHRHVLRAVYASLVEGWHAKDSQEFYRLVG